MPRLLEMKNKRNCTVDSRLVLSVLVAILQTFYGNSLLFMKMDQRQNNSR